MANGSTDYWLVRLDSAGSKLWEKAYWGSSSDCFSGLEKTAGGGLLLGGTSSSPPGGGKTSPLFGEWFDFGDYWVMQVDEADNKVWEKSFGGAGADILGQGIQTADGGFILAGSSSSPIEGNKAVPAFGGGDFWVVKLGPDALSTPPRLWLPLQSAAEIGATGSRLILEGVLDQNYVIEYSQDQQLWQPLRTNRLSQPVLELVDTGAANVQKRFYRARVVP